MSDNYLNEEEQYKEILSASEISCVKDTKLREIRSKYFDMRNKLLLDESVSDVQLTSDINAIDALENAEIEEYKRSLNQD